MNLELAVVESCSPIGCEVKMLNDGRSVSARYSALVEGKVKILPGQMVAVDFSPATPEIAWRWYRTQVVAVTPNGASVKDRERILDAISVPGLETDLVPGAEVWVTGMQGAWEIHDRVIGGAPQSPARLYELVLPRIVSLLSQAPAA